MPSLDFDQIARAILGNDDPELLGDLLEGMRQVWNARGAADLEQLQQVGTYAPFESVTRIIQALDR